MGYFSNAVKGIGWMGSLQGVFRLLTLLKFVVIARVLDPANLGLFGLVMLMVSFFESVSDFGLSLYIIQNIKKEEELIDAVWTVSIIRGLLLTMLLLLASYPVAEFFHASANLPLFLIASVIPVVKSFSNPSIAKFQKHLQFHKEFIFRTLLTLTEVLSSITLVILLKSPIALIYSLILSSIVETLLSLVVVKPMPRFTFEIEKIREIVHFGKWISLIGTTSFFANQLDSIVVGRILGVGDLGIYQMAQKFSLKIMSEAGDVVAKVAFPIFAKIKEDKERLKKAFSKTLLVTSISFGIVTLGLILFSSKFILLVIGPKWLIADNPLKFFAMLGLATVIMSIINSLFLALGRQDITAKLIVLRLIILAFVMLWRQNTLNIITISILSLVSLLAIFPFMLVGLKNILSVKRS